VHGLLLGVGVFGDKRLVDGGVVVGELRVVDAGAVADRQVGKRLN